MRWVERLEYTGSATDGTFIFVPPYIAGEDERFVFQVVHVTHDRAVALSERPIGRCARKLVFIGRNLEVGKLRDGLADVPR
jgi:hypothetical protein